MLPIVLERSFQTWSYGVGHSQLVMRSRARVDDDVDLVAHFEHVVAMETRSTYRPLVIDVLDPARYDETIRWLDIPAHLRDRFLYLSVSSGSPRGYVVCGRVNVFAVPAGLAHPRVFERPPGSRVLHTIRRSDPTAAEEPSG